MERDQHFPLLPKVDRPAAPPSQNQRSSSRPGHRDCPNWCDRAGQIAHPAQSAVAPKGNSWRTTARRAWHRSAQSERRIHDKSIRSGALDCIRYAISYEFIRVRISGSPVSSRRVRLSAVTVSKKSRSHRRSIPVDYGDAGSGHPGPETEPLGTKSVRNRCSTTKRPPAARAARFAARRNRASRWRDFPVHT